MHRRLLATLAVVAAACQPSPERGAQATPAAPPIGLAAPAAAPGRGPALDLDLSEVLGQVRRAVRRDGDWLRAGGEFHQLSVDAAGRVRLASLAVPVAELRLETSAITRGGQSLAGPSAARAEGATVVVTRGALEERLENRADGVEQRWRLGARPAGAGDLLVSVRAAGLAYAGATASGLHFGDPGRGAMVRYGAATLVDAAGTRTPLASRFTSGVIAISVPAAALEAAAYPVVIDPVLSVERAVDQPPGGGPASGAQVRPSVACLSSGGGTCLVAWQDQVLQPFGGGSQIRAARVSGSTLSDSDPNGIDIDLGSSTSDCGPPIVLQTVNGGVKEFAVVYSSFDQLGVSTSLRRLKLARVSAAGALLGTPVQLSNDLSGNVLGYDAASDGTTVAVVWSDLQDVWFTTFANGVTMVAPTVPVPKGSVPPEESTRWDRPAVIWTGSEWFLAWRGSWGTAPSVGQAIRVAFVDKSGVVVPFTPFGNAINGTVQGSTPDFLSQPILASDGAGTVLALTAWKNGFDPYPGQVLAMRFSKLGQDATAWPIAVPNVFNNNEASGLSAWWNGTDFAVLLQSQRGIGQSAQVQTSPSTPFTVVPGTSPSLSAPSQVFPATGAAINAVRAMPDGSSAPVLVWEDTSSGLADVRANRIRLDSRTGSLLLTTGAADQAGPAAAYDGGVWLVAWEDKRTVAADGASDLFAVRLNRTDGVAIDTAGIDLTGAPGFQGSAVAAGGGGGFLVAWADGRAVGNNIDIWATRVTTAGVVNAASTQVTSTTTRNEFPQSAAFDGTDYHLLYTVEDPLLAPSQVVRDVRLQPFDLMTKSIADVATPSNPNNRLHAQLACRGAGCLAAWSEETGSAIVARTIVGGSPAAGTVTWGTTPPATPIPAVSAAATGSPAFLVAWSEPNWATQVTDVKAQMVALDGSQFGTPFQLASGASGATGWTAASFDGTDHVVSWSPDSGGLYAGWVSATGTARAPATSLVPSGLSAPRPIIATAGDGEGRTLLAYTVFDPAPGIRAQRVKVRLASFAKLLGDACTLAGQCGSGFCVEGVCCDTGCGGGTDLCQTCSARNGHGTPGHCAIATNDTCNDGQACTSADHCDAAGACGGTSYACTPTQCQLTSSCDGAGGCTTTAKPNSTSCDDGDACTSSDQCSNGLCVGTPLSCPSGETCQGGTCQAGQGKSGPGAALGFSCGSGPAGSEALLLAVALLGLVTRRARSHS